VLLTITRNHSAFLLRSLFRKCKQASSKHIGTERSPDTARGRGREAVWSSSRRQALTSTGTRSTEPVPGQEGAAPHDLPQRRRGVGGRQGREQAGSLPWVRLLPKGLAGRAPGQEGVCRPATRMGFTHSAKLTHTPARPHRPHTVLCDLHYSGFTGLCTETLHLSTADMISDTTHHLPGAASRSPKGTKGKSLSQDKNSVHADKKIKKIMEDYKASSS